MEKLSVTIRAATAGLLISSVFSACVLAGDAESPGSKHCINLTRIQSIDVLDKQHILFRTPGNKTYVNTLPRPCPGLQKNKPILYKTSLSELCDLDIITVLESIGSGYQPGASCGLGTFELSPEPGIASPND